MPPTEQAVIMIPSPCLSVKLPEITFDSIQQMLEKMYLTWRANPAYLFCSKQDSEKIEAGILRYTIRCHSHSNDVHYPIARWVNQTTGKFMHIVILPDLEDGTLLFGFITY